MRRPILRSPLRVLLRSSLRSSFRSPLRAVLPAEREQVREWMSGNYCRCTGYHAIVDAVCAVLEQQKAGRFMDEPVGIDDKARA